MPFRSSAHIPRLTPVQTAACGTPHDGTCRCTAKPTKKSPACDGLLWHGPVHWIAIRLPLGWEAEALSPLPGQQTRRELTALSIEGKHRLA